MAVSAEAAGHGLTPGQLLSDARPLCPDLRVLTADPNADRTALERLSDWCGRYTPWTACWPDPLVAQSAAAGTGRVRGDRGQPERPLGSALGTDETGLFLDITGCAHLFGGEAALLGDLKARLKGFGIGARLALADTPGAAWALSRYGESETIVPPGAQDQALADLPIAALRLSPALVGALTGLGLKTVGALAHLPRAPLAARFGTRLLHRLDQASGRMDEPISPALPFVPYRARMVLAEPISEQAHVTHGLERLAADLTASLQRDGHGARRFTLSLFQVDGQVRHVTVGAARPIAEARAVTTLFGEAIARLGGALDAGFGIDVLVLSGEETEALAPDQYGFLGADEEGDWEDEDRFDLEISGLMDRLGNRLGLDRVRIFRPLESHLPERSVMAVPVRDAMRERRGKADGAGGWPARPGEGLAAEGERPLALLPCAEPVDVVAGVPEGPPRLFRWRGASFQVARSEGPERIAPEWWRTGTAGDQSRDYYRVEDKEGRRFWLYRHGLYGRETGEPQWYLHGVFS